MVTAPHHLAARAGLRVLEEGGNAIEAMVAAAAAITVVYPHMNALGGDVNAQKPGYGYADQKAAGATGAEAPSHGWTEHTAPEGYVYYYNSRTGVSQWERPMELDFPK